MTDIDTAMRRAQDMDYADLLVQAKQAMNDGGTVAAMLAIANRLDRIGDLLEPTVASASPIEDEPCGSWRVTEYVPGPTIAGVTFSPPLTSPARTVWCGRRSGPCPYAGTAQTGAPPPGHGGGWGGMPPYGPACAVEREASDA